jgi:2-keto-4-pentenoate hydratase/2-oxohepta-3-ene-1,7-dioic acid hydratase in catechol pathway
MTQSNDTTHQGAFRIFCIGRNYMEHIHELNSELLQAPPIFQKPPTSLVPAGGKVPFPKHGHDLHHETEVVVRIGKGGKPENIEAALSFVDSLTLGLDLTLRDVQRYQKQKGLPWEIAKSFDHSAPIGDFVAYNDAINLKEIEFTCRVNGDIRQQGNTKDMLYPIENLILEVSKIWQLVAGDLIFTGTPAGVGPLQIGDTIEIESPQLGSYAWSIVE